MERVADPEFLALLLEGDRLGAEHSARAIFDREGVTFLYERVIEPALCEVGELWFSNRISVADEHLATATAEAAAASLYPFFPWPARGPRALIACPQGEHHEFGARMVADLLALDGWDERFTGADVPIEALAGKVKELEPRMVGLSVTLPLNVPAIREAIALVRASCPSAKILVGGRALTAPSDFAALGAHAFARCGSEAVEVARAWK